MTFNLQDKTSVNFSDSRQFKWKTSFTKKIFELSGQIWPFIKAYISNLYNPRTVGRNPHQTVFCQLHNILSNTLLPLRSTYKDVIKVNTISFSNILQQFHNIPFFVWILHMLSKLVHKDLFLFLFNHIFRLYKDL